MPPITFTLDRDGDGNVLLVHAGKGNAILFLNPEFLHHLASVIPPPQTAPTRARPHAPVREVPDIDPDIPRQ